MISAMYTIPILPYFLSLQNTVMDATVLLILLILIQMEFMLRILETLCMTMTAASLETVQEQRKEIKELMRVYLDEEIGPGLIGVVLNVEGIGFLGVDDIDVELGDDNGWLLVEMIEEGNEDENAEDAAGGEDDDVGEVGTPGGVICGVVGIWLPTHGGG